MFTHSWCVVDGLSIPFFSFGRNVRTRTLSLSRTWTSRNTNAPDWLLGARRTPAEIVPPGTATTTVSQDVERGLTGLDPAVLANPTLGLGLGDDKKEKHVPELGPAAMLSEATEQIPGPTNSSSVRQSPRSQRLI